MDGNGIGDRLKEYRKSLGMSQADLARKSNVSAAYVSELESGLGKRPSGEILLRLANALEVTIADLLGQDIRPGDGDPPVPDSSLLEFAREHRLPRSDVEMLASIRFRGDPPRTSRRWAMIYDTIVTSRTLDEIWREAGRQSRRLPRQARRERPGPDNNLVVL